MPAHLEGIKMRIGSYKFVECTSTDSKGVSHGHLYKVEVVLEGALKGGIVIDFAIVKKDLLATLAKFNNQSLNDLFAEPTPENLALQIFKDMHALHPGLEAVRLWEGEDTALELGRDEALKMDAPRAAA